MIDFRLRRAAWPLALILILTGGLTHPAAATRSSHTPAAESGTLTATPVDPLGCDRANAACADRQTIQTINGGNGRETYSYRLAVQIRDGRVRPALDISAHRTRGTLRVCQGEPVVRSVRDLRARCLNPTRFSRDHSQLEDDRPIVGTGTLVSCTVDSRYFAILTDFELRGSPSSGLVIGNIGQRPSAAFGEVTPSLRIPGCPSPR